MVLIRESNANKITPSCQRRACPRESVGLASTLLTPRPYSQALGFRLVDSRLRGNDEVTEALLTKKQRHQCGTGLFFGHSTHNQRGCLMRLA